MAKLSLISRNSKRPTKWLVPRLFHGKLNANPRYVCDDILFSKRDFGKL